MFSTTSFRAYYLRKILKTKGGEALENWCRRHAERVLDNFLPDWKKEGDYARIGAHGAEGRRCSLNLDNFAWVDFAEEENVHFGVVPFLVEILGSEVLASLKDFWQESVGLGDKGAGMPVDFDAAIMPPQNPLPKSTVMKSLGNRLEIKQSWAYLDIDGELLGKRVRCEDDNGEKQVWTWTYRTAGTVKRKGQYVPIAAGWHWRAGWGRTVPPYGLQDLGDSTLVHNAIQQGGGVLLVEGEKTRDAAVEWLEEIDERNRWLVLSWGNAGGVKRCWLDPVRELLQAATDMQAANTAPAWYGAVVWPDSDSAGIEASYNIAEKLGDARGVDTSDLLSGGWNGWDLADPVPLGLVKASGYENEHQWRWAKIIESTPLPTRARRAEVNSGDYIYVQMVDKWWSQENRCFVTSSQIDRWHGTVTGKDKMSILLSENPEVEKVSRITYKPGDYTICWDKDPEGDSRIRCLNLWQPPQILPESRCSEEEAEERSLTFLKHMELLIPEEDVREKVLDWLAWQVQRTGHKVSYSLVLQGEQGTGKSYLGQLMKKLLGQSFISVNYETMARDFNSWEQGRSLVLVEEALAGGRKDFYNRMKTRITEPTMVINQKGLSEFVMHNRTNYMILTNDENPIYIDPGDRRFFVYFSPMTPQSTEYYEKLFGDLEENSSYISRWMMDRDLSEFKPGSRAPFTEAKQSVIEESQAPWESSLEMAVESRDSIFSTEVVRVQEVLEWLERKRHRAPSKKAVSRVLKKLGWDSKVVRLSRCNKVHRFWYNTELWETFNEDETYMGSFAQWLLDRWLETWASDE